MKTTTKAPWQLKKNENRLFTIRKTNLKEFTVRTVTGQRVRVFEIGEMSPTKAGRIAIQTEKESVCLAAGKDYNDWDHAFFALRLAIEEEIRRCK